MLEASMGIVLGVSKRPKNKMWDERKKSLKEFSLEKPCPPMYYGHRRLPNLAEDLCLKFELGLRCYGYKKQFFHTF
jgi:hypothetical protein